MLYTFPHELDYEVGRKIVQAVPGIDQVRFANSGSEATQAAIRLARAYTGKDKIMKWEGSYNGFLDCHAFSHVPALEAAGTEKFPRTLPSPGRHPQGRSRTPSSSRRSTTSTRSRCSSSATATSWPACSAEPILGDAGIIPPVPGFPRGAAAHLRRERRACSSSTRSSPASACRSAAPRSCTGSSPDITCIAKAVGGGTPGAAAFGGKKEIMQLEADGVVLHGGTYSGNPLTLAGMNAALDILINDRERVYGHLNTIANAMVQGMRGIFAENGVPAYISQVGPMWQVFFGHEEPVTKYRQARASDTRFFGMLQTECQTRGVYFHNFNFERFFASTAHTKTEVDRSLEVIADGDEDRQDAAQHAARRGLSRHAVLRASEGRPARRERRPGAPRRSCSGACPVELRSGVAVRLARSAQAGAPRTPGRRPRRRGRRPAGPPRRSPRGRRAGARAAARPTRDDADLERQGRHRAGAQEVVHHAVRLGREPQPHRVPGEREVGDVERPELDEQEQEQPVPRLAGVRAGPAHAQLRAHRGSLVVWIEDDPPSLAIQAATSPLTATSLTVPATSAIEEGRAAAEAAAHHAKAAEGMRGRAGCGGSPTRCAQTTVVPS